MGRSNRDVGGYRGRRTVTDILKFIAIILGVLVVLAVAGVIYLQRYVVYTDEGTRLELPPFLQMLRGGDSAREPEGSASVPAPGDLSIDIQPAASQPEPEETAGFALALPVSDVLDGSAAGKLAEAGAEALVLEMKTRDGRLAWLSGQTMAGRSRVNGTQAANDALRQWNAGEVYTVARVCCFRDDAAPYYNNGQALRNGNGNWRDELGLRWLSPADEKAQAYLAGLCGELAGLGFDEIVLEQYAFPVQGKLERISKGRPGTPEERTAQVEAFLTRVQAAVEPYGTTVVSLRVTPEALGEGSAASGAAPELLERFGERIWGDGESLSALSGLENGRKVEVVSQAGEERALFQAVIPEQ